MPISNKPTLSEVMAMFGKDGTPTLRDYVRGGSFVLPGIPANANISTTAAALRLSQFVGADIEILMSLTGNHHQLDIRNRFNLTYGAPTGAVQVRVRINPGCHVFSSIASIPALTVGDFPAGSKIIIENRGRITGARGVPNAGAGGDSIYHNAKIPLAIYNYGDIAPGGGAGGVGGQGGQGVYQTSYAAPLGGGWDVLFGCEYSCTAAYGSSAYCLSQGPQHCGSNDGTYYRCTDCRYTAYQNNYTSGGAGGAGGSGYGCYDAAGNVANATAGTTGGAPGTNAGWGGTGGSGGASGTSGGTGTAGGNGNYTGGSAGAAGGAAGRWAVHHDTFLTLALNEGTIHGNKAII